MLKPSFRTCPTDITLPEKIVAVGGANEVRRFTATDLDLLEWLGEKDQDGLLDMQVLAEVSRDDLSKFGVSDYLLSCSVDEIEANAFLSELHPIDIKRFNQEWDDLRAMQMLKAPSHVYCKDPGTQLAFSLDEIC